MAIDQQTAYARSAQKAPDGAAPAKGDDAVRFWRERRFDDLACLTARFFRHASAPHAHHPFAIGAILAGPEPSRSGVARPTARAASLVSLHSDPPHDVAAAEESSPLPLPYHPPPLSNEP